MREKYNKPIFKLVLIAILACCFIMVIIQATPALATIEPTPAPENEFVDNPSGDSAAAPGKKDLTRGYVAETFIADYYDSDNLEDFVIRKQQTEPILFYLDCNDDEYPYVDCQLIPELADGSNYSVKWQAKFVVPSNGFYTFSFIIVDDGARILLDGDEIMDWGWYYPDDDISPSPQRIFLRKGQHDIEIDYEQRVQSLAIMDLRWAGPGFKQEVIPIADTE